MLANSFCYLAIAHIENNSAEDIKLIACIDALDIAEENSKRKFTHF